MEREGTIVYSHSETPSLLISEKPGFLECCVTYPSMEQMDLKLKATVLLSSLSSLGELVQVDHSPG